MNWLKLVAVLILPVVFLFGCGSTPEKQPETTGAMAQPQPEIGDVSARPGAQSEGNMATAVPEPTIAKIDPLEDPNNILSKKSIYFDFDQYSIKDDFRDMISAHAEFLAKNPSAKVTIEGNCDERGTREYNISLGDRRARAVEQMLVLLGASTSQISTISYGEERPSMIGHNENAWSRNRRADIVYTSR